MPGKKTLSQVKVFELSMNDYTTIQVHKFVYGYTGLTNPAKMIQFQLSDNGTYGTYELAKPPMQSKSPSLASYKNQYIFAIGGSKRFSGQARGTTSLYDIQRNKWRTLMPLKTWRTANSSCALGEMLYTMCGKDDQLNYLSSIERLHAHAVVNGVKSEWHLIEIASGSDVQSFVPRAQTFAIGFPETEEIMILGGYASEL